VAKVLLEHSLWCKIWYFTTTPSELAWNTNE